MKDVTLIVWLTQLGLSVSLPMCGFVLLAVWLKNQFSWGNWVIFVGIGFGLICAVEGFLSSLKAMSRIGKGRKNESPPPVSFNEHE